MNVCLTYSVSVRRQSPISTALHATSEEQQMYLSANSASDKRGLGAAPTNGERDELVRNLDGKVEAQRGQ